MKKVTDAKTDSGVGGGWFKIAQDAFDGSKWGVDRLIANQGNQTVTIPACIAPGQYLLRGELIALHAASQLLGAQFYMVSFHPPFLVLSIEYCTDAANLGMRTNKCRWWLC